MAEFQPLLDAGRSRRRGMGRQAKRSPAGMVGVRKWIAAASVKVVTSQLHPKIDFHQLCCRDPWQGEKFAIYSLYWDFYNCYYQDLNIY